MDFYAALFTFLSLSVAAIAVATALVIISMHKNGVCSMSFCVVVRTTFADDIFDEEDDPEPDEMDDQGKTYKIRLVS